MREIKFRAWDSYHKHMVSDVLVSTYRDKTTVFWRFPLGASWPWKNDDAGVYNNTGEVLPMQYTGLKDKNGVEIYEGDILDATQVSVEFKDGCFIIPNYGTVIEYLHSRTRRGDTIEVIGNIYENQELLEAGILQKGENR